MFLTQLFAQEKAPSQMAVTVLVLDLLRLSGRLSITPYTLRSGMSFLPASLCFGLHSTLRQLSVHFLPHLFQTRMRCVNMNHLQSDGSGRHEHSHVRRCQEVHAARQPRSQRCLSSKASAVGEKEVPCLLTLNIKKWGRMMKSKDYWLINLLS